MSPFLRSSPAQENRLSPTNTESDIELPASIWLGVLALVPMAWVAGRIGLYTPGSDLGYYMGLVGAILMAFLLLYPLRKYARFLRRAFGMRLWFKLHIFLGILGPLLVIYHSTLKLNSFNASVAFYSMLLVVGSGIVGRFIYTKVHHGLSGRQVTLRDRQEQLGLAGESLKSKFNFAPRVEQRLKRLEAYATDETRPGLLGVRRFFGIIVRGHYAYWRSMREVDRILSRATVKLSWSRQERIRRTQFAGRMIKEYLRELRELAHFRTYERLFSLWHLLHVPFAIMLVLSAIAHIIAVHMY